MPLEPDDQSHVTAAQGYVELMFLDADAELDKVDADVRHLPEVLAARLQVYSALGRWELMLVVAKKLAHYNPDEPQWPVSWAYATRRAESIDAAKAILTEAVERLPKAAIMHYNLACYECQLGNLEEAKERLQRAFRLDSNYRLLAMEDDDLRPLWDSLATQVI